jgi:hypothetical protein
MSAHVSRQDPLLGKVDVEGLATSCLLAEQALLEETFPLVLLPPFLLLSSFFFFFITLNLLLFDSRA